METAAGAGHKKGCILVQFPSSVKPEQYKDVEHILLQLKLHNPEYDWRIAVEFRRAEWYMSETVEMLNETGAALVLHDFQKGSIMEMTGNPPFVYLRFHGPNGDYKDRYTNVYLENKSKSIKKWMEEGKDVYIYFNNTIGDAFNNAVYLQSLVERKEV